MSEVDFWSIHLYVIIWNYYFEEVTSGLDIIAYKINSQTPPSCASN